MNSPTRGHDRTKIRKPVIEKIIALRKDGYTCAQIAKMTNTGESTVARYTSDWYQRQKKRGFKAFRGVQGQQTDRIVAPTKEPIQKKQPESLPPEVLEYINAIYKKNEQPKGTFIGNLFIQIGKAFGGHNPV